MGKGTLALTLIAWGGIAAAAIQKAPITDIEIEGIGDAEKLTEVIGLKKGDLYTPAKVERAKAAIVKALQKQGIYGTTVEAKVKPVNDSVAITFDVNKGEEIRIKKVSFVGNKQVEADDLEENLVNKEGTWFSWIPIIGGGGGKAVPEQLPYDQMRIREAYLERGFLDAQVAEPLMKMDFASKEAEITYSVKEGEPYDVGSVKISGNIPGIDKAKVMEELSLKPGKRFNVKKLRKDIARLYELVGDQGYAFARIEPMFKKDAKNHKVSVIYKIQPGKKVKIRDVVISGNTKTLDYVVRRYVYLAPGDYFSYTDLQDSRKELQRTGFFDKVVIKPQRINDHEMDLVVEVDEAQTGSISGGFGYGSYDGFMVNASVSERNLFGTGIAGSVSLEYGQKSHNYAFSITDPRVFNTLFSLSVGAYDSKYEYDYLDDDDADTQNYSVSRRGGWISIGRKIGRTMHASIGYSYTDVDYDDYVVPSGVNPHLYDSYTKSSLLASLTYDTTDDFYTPREGIYSKLSLEYAGVGGDADFWKADWKLAAYYGMEDMIDYDLIMRYKLHAGYMSDEGNTPVAEMYTLGGARYGVRGFSPGSISPRYYDPVHDDYYIAGGDQILVNSVEASIPLEIITKNMRLTGFVDYGMIRNTIDSAVSDEWVKRASAGAQIEWRSPFGPINFVFAKPLNEKKRDQTAVFEFYMGGKF